MAEVPEDVRAYLNAYSEQEDVRAEEEDGWGDPWFEVEEGETGITDMEVADIGRFIVNAGPSAIRNIEYLYDAVTSPVQTIKGIASLAAGTVAGGASMLFGGGEGEFLPKERAVARMVWEELKKRYGSELRKTIVEDPVGILMDIEALASGGATLMRKGPQIASQIAKYSPARLLMRGAGEAVEDVGNVARTVATDLVIGPGTGAGPVPARMAYEAGVEGGPAANQFRTGLRGTQSEAMAEQMVTDATSASRTIASKNNQLYAKEVQKMVDEGVLKATPNFDVHRDMKLAEVDGELARGVDRLKIGRQTRELIEERMRATPRRTDEVEDFLIYGDYVHTGEGANSRIRFDWTNSSVDIASDQRIIEHAFAKIYDWDQWHTVNGIKDIRKMMRKQRDKLDVHQNPDAREVLREIERAISDELYDILPQIKEVDIAFGKTARKIEEFESVFNLTTRQGKARNPIQVMRNLSRAFRESPDADLMLDILQKIEKEADVMLSANVGGQAMQSWFPSGLHGKQIAFAALGVGTIGSAWNPMAWLALPAVSPRVMGEFLMASGAFKRHTVVRAQRWMDAVQKRVPPGMITPGTPIGLVLARMQEQGLGVPPPPPVELTKKMGDRYQKEMKPSPAASEAPYEGPVRPAPAGRILKGR